MQCHDLDIPVIRLPVGPLVLDAQVGKMHLSVEVREVMIARPFLNLSGFTVRPAIGMVVVAILRM
jgi:hypothetical protein